MQYSQNITTSVPCRNNFILVILDLFYFFVALKHRCKLCEYYHRKIFFFFILRIELNFHDNIVYSKS